MTRPAGSPGPGAQGRLRRLRPYLPTVAGWRRSTRGQARLARARAGADRGLLAAFAVLVVVAAALAVGVPRQLTRTVDGGARAAVRAAGEPAAVDVQLLARWVEADGVSAARPGQGRPVTAKDLREAAEAVRESTPAELARILEPVTISALGPPITVTSVQPAARRTAPLIARVGWADPGTGGQVTWVRGRAPLPGEDPDLVRPVVPVGVSEAAATAWGLEPGTRIEGRRGPAGRSTLLVTGVFSLGNPRAAVWRTLDSASAPVPRDPGRVGARIDEITFLVDADALPLAEAGLGGDGLQAHLHRLPAYDRITGARLRAAHPVLRSYQQRQLSPISTDPSASFVSELPSVVRAYRLQARAVVAQLSVAVVSVIGVASVLLLLAAQLLTRRRRLELALQHARGASLTAVGVGLLLESAAVAAPALAVGAALGVVATPHATGDVGPLLVVAAVAVTLGPVLGMLTARAAWAGRSTPANRRARGRLRLERQLRRGVAELLVLAVAAAAVVSLRTRGLTPSSAAVDPLLAATPLLVTAAFTVVVLRAYPWPMRLVVALARRRRGALALVMAARAAGGLSWSPLLALTLSVGLMVGTGLIRTTLVEGQEAASWERVGADVRVDLRKAVPGDAQLAQLRALPGVDDVCVGHVGGGTTAIGVGNAAIDAIVVDPACYRRVLAASGLGTARELDRLAAPLPDGSVPGVLAGPVTWPARPVELTLGAGTRLRVTAVGRASVPPTGWHDGPVVVLDAARVRAAGWRGVDTTLWAVGPGASAAVTAQPQAPAWDVHDRRQWLAERTGTGVVADLGALLVVALLLLAVFAALAMVQTVAAGAAERGRAVSLVRTLGLTLRAGRGLTVGELVPLAVAGVGAGALAGFALVSLVAPALGMEQVTGGVTPPALRLAPGWALAVGAAALAVVGVAAGVESLLQRRAHLASVLRVGGR
ncbi:MAG: hypothetical protein U0Q15_18135 [Kineosporiaceae bacterium]